MATRLAQKLTIAVLHVAHHAAAPMDEVELASALRAPKPRPIVAQKTAVSGLGLKTQASPMLLTQHPQRKPRATK